MMNAVIFLCDLTGNAAKPWAEAGFDCYCVDIQHSIRNDRVVQVGAGRIHYVWGDVRSWAPPRGVRPIFGVSFTECTHVAVSGSQDWPKKRGYMLRDALEQFEAARQSFEWAGIPYVQENSVGIFGNKDQIPHIGKPSHYFQPWEYAGWCEDDNYTKKTALWSGNGFIMPEKKPAPWLGPPDDRIHKAPPGDDRANFRSASPMGFWTAVFHANNPLQYAPSRPRTVAVAGRKVEMCNCIANIGEKLKEHNTRLSFTFCLTRDLSGMDMLPIVATEKIETKKRGREMTVVATFCPFCGEKYPRKEDVGAQQ